MSVGLKERLERLESVSGEKRRVREEIISDLRKRLERLVEPRRVTRVERACRPFADVVEGEAITTPHGPVFMREETYGSGYRHGGMLLDRVMEVPTDPVSVVCADETLLGLDFSDTLFIDTETTGLSGGTGTIAFMVGVGYFEGSRFVIRQFFLRDLSEEPALLWALADLACRFRFLSSFNGKRFDIPLLETRFILARMSDPLSGLPNYDLLYPSRRIWRGAFEDCRLATLESCVLDVSREDDVPSEMIPYLYFDYLRTGDGSRIDRVFYHNRMDILSLVTLAARIHELVDTPSMALKGRWFEAFALGRLFSQNRRMDDAIVCFHDALRSCREPEEWEILKSLSLALKREGKLNQAADVWREMIAFDETRELFPYEEVAKFYEHRAKDVTEALRWVGEAFDKVKTMSPVEREALRHRHERLQVKVKRKTCAVRDTGS